MNESHLNPVGNPSGVRVTVHPDTLAAADAERAVGELARLTDAHGRVMMLKKPDVLMLIRFERLFGDENAIYRTIMGALTWLRAIDGDTIFAPTSALEYEALAQRVGEAALHLIIDRVAEIQKLLAKHATQQRAELKN